MENNPQATMSFMIICSLGLIVLMNYLGTKGTYDTITYAVDTIYGSMNRIQSQSIKRDHDITDNLYKVYEEIENLENENKILKEKIDLLETVVYNKFVRNRG